MSVSRWCKCFIVLLTTTFVLSSVPIRKDNSVRAATVINHNNEQTQETKVFRSVENHSFKAAVKTVSKWSSHANIEISFTNTGKDTIHDWYFTFDYDYAIENPSNCYIVEHKDNLYTIANNNWNQDIGPGKTVKIGFTAASSDGSSITKNPSFYLLNTKTVSLTEKELPYKFEEYSDWGSGFSGALVLTNASNDYIRDWTISFGTNRPLIKADSATLKIKADNTYTICNDGNNQNISKGKSYRIGIQGGYHDSSIPFELIGYTITAKKLAIKLSEDKNKNGIADVRETDYSGAVIVTPTPSATTMPSNTPVPTATSTPVPTSTNTPTPTNAPTSTPTTVPAITTVPTSMPSITPTLTPSPEPTMTSTPEPTGSPTPTAIPTTTPIPTGIPVDIDYDKDSDSDGLPDDIENYYGTDKNNADTDGDGVNDLCELLLNSDPKTADNIGSLDRDGDGLSNAKESELGTNPTVKDTDLDGLSDGEEYKRCGTDPLKYDTDDDGISDYNEVQLGSNPKVQDSSIKRHQAKTLKITDESGLKGVTEITVSGEISGSMVENTQINDVFGKDIHTSSIEALVGNPVSITTTGAFDTMTITFKYTESLNEKNLRIMWYDEENCEYVVLDNYNLDESNKTISVTTNHFSTYMLIDEEVWVKTWAKACASLNYSGGNRYSNIVHPNNGIGYTDYKTADEFLKALKGEYSDGDSDGIVNPVETAGMIDNIGHIIKTIPTSFDSDDDGLNDGEEIGRIKLVGDKISDSKFFEYNILLPVESGRQYGNFVYYAGSSDPSNEDSDGDGAKDNEDSTPNLENEPVNYVLYYKEFRITGLFGNKEEYCRWFSTHGMKYEAFEINNANEFKSFWKNMCHECKEFNNVSDNGFTPKIQYSYVKNLVIIFHGAPDEDQLVVDTGNGFTLGMDESYIEEIVGKETKQTIECINCQACYAQRDINHNGKTVASSLMASKKVKKVYASDGPMSFIPFININTTQSKYHIYLLERDSSDKIQSYPIGQSTYLMLLEK